MCIFKGSQARKNDCTFKYYFRLARKYPKIIHFQLRCTFPPLVRSCTSYIMRVFCFVNSVIFFPTAYQSDIVWEL